MKVLVVLALLGCAFARPAYEYVDPDCIEEDLAIAEPGAYDSALGEPELVINFDQEEGRSDADYDDCEDVLTTAGPTEAPVQKQEVTEECEDALTTAEVVEVNSPEPVYIAPVAKQAEVVTEECEDALTTVEVTAPVWEPTDPPVQKKIETEPGCVDETTEPPPSPAPVQKAQTTQAEDCIDDEPAGTEENPFLNFHVEKAQEAPEAILMAFDSPIDEIEECDDY